MGLLSLLTLGFFLGMRHATDSDHVVAVTAIVSRERSVRAASLVGALWGIGHTLTIMIVGGAIVVFGVVFPARAGLTMEFSVALMLVILGALNVAGFRRDVQKLRSQKARITHQHGGGGAHSHGSFMLRPILLRAAGLRAPLLHAPVVRGPLIRVPLLRKKSGGRADAAPPSDAPAPLLLGRLGAYGAVRSLVVGTVHGLAGSAAVALLVLATIRDSASALLYLAVFGVGTVAGMMLITSALAVPIMYTSRKSPSWSRHIGWATGLLSLGTGLFLAYQIGFVDGLFGATPHWAPR